MANIIDASFFVGDIEIPNSNQPYVEADLNNSIAIYEKEVLVSLLGYALYKELKASSYVAGDLSKFDRLVNGDPDDFTFTVDGVGVTAKWDGLIGEDKKSLIAYYVYFMHRRKRASYFSGAGQEVEAETENSKKTSLYEKLVYIWNEFVNMYGGQEFEDGTTLGYYYPETDQPTAYNYLLAKKADFTNWKFSSQGGELNRFGI